MLSITATKSIQQLTSFKLTGLYSKLTARQLHHADQFSLFYNYIVLANT
jgi:hypothetical protein